MLVLLLLAQVASPPQAKAAVRIAHAQKATAEAWQKAPPLARREFRRTDPDGRVILVRTIEHE